MKDYEGENGSHGCPYCSSLDSCAHLLLLVDRTFRVAEGGVLMAAFNERWNELCDFGGDDFDEREPFENLLDEVDAFADASTDYDQEGGPGMSSSYSIYYTDSADKTRDVLAQFMSGGEA